MAMKLAKEGAKMVVGSIEKKIEEKAGKKALQYAMEDYYKMLAAEGGLDPAQGQAATWVGNAKLTGVDSDPSMTSQQLFNRRVAMQSIKRDMDPKDLLTLLMKGGGYLSLGGIGLGGAGQFMPGRFDEETN